MATKNLTPFRYEIYCQCPKACWMNAYQPEEEETSITMKTSAATESQMRSYAKTLFPDCVSAKKRNEDFSYDFEEMERRTAAFLGADDVIFNATFCWNGNYAMVGILEKTSAGYVIYDIKTSANSKNEPDMKKLQVYANRMAYNKYILTQCGLDIADCRIICLNGDYVRGAELDINELLTNVSIDELVVSVYDAVANNIISANIMLEGKRPDCQLGKQCKDPHECLFKKYCMKDVPANSVFNLYRVFFKNAASEYYGGLKTFKDLNESQELQKRSEDKKAKGFKLNAMHRIQIESVLGNKAVIDVDGLRSFVDSLTYPLYFLDFETILPTIPAYEASKAYQQIPFQYSLHYIEQEGAELKHKEFLAEDDATDPRRVLAEHIVADIPMNVCTIAYNKMFECGRLKELAAMFPDLSEHLLNISEHIVDLLEPFTKGYYYAPKMNGSFSIKSVLPALFPDDPELDYHNLEGCVHNGLEAMEIFPTIKDMSESIKAGIRESLLRYCELDTYAMVKIYWRILDIVNGKFVIND